MSIFPDFKEFLYYLEFMTQLIPFENVLLSFIPLIILIIILYSLIGDVKRFIIASLRMLLQLVAIGYLLKSLFSNENDLLTLLALLVMLVMAAIISMSSAYKKNFKLYTLSFVSLLFGAFPTLVFMTYFIIPSDNWLKISFIIPLAGMIFSQAMNVMSLALERFQKEREHNDYSQARKLALKASLIPITNTFMAVGLVSFPGMMTGQILAGIEPLIAVRYQIIIMTMVFSSVASSTMILLYLMQKLESDH